MNAAESKALKKGSRVYWRGNDGDSGRVTFDRWDASARRDIEYNNSARLFPRLARDIRI